MGKWSGCSILPSLEPSWSAPGAVLGPSKERRAKSEGSEGSKGSEGKEAKEAKGAKKNRAMAGKRYGEGEGPTDWGCFGGLTMLRWADHGRSSEASPQPVPPPCTPGSRPVVAVFA